MWGLYRVLIPGLLVNNVVSGLCWVVVKIMVSFWVLSMIQHRVFRGPQKGP